MSRRGEDAPGEGGEPEEFGRGRRKRQRKLPGWASDYVHVSRDAGGGDVNRGRWVR